MTTDTQPALNTYTEIARQQSDILSHAMQLGLASQAITPQKFLMCIDAATVDLSGTAFTEQNFNKILETLKEILGNEHVSATTFNKTTGSATITFSNGRTISLKEGQ